MVWVKVGSARLSKGGQHLIMVIDKVRYVIDLAYLDPVLNRSADYAVISKPPVDQPKA